MPKGGSRHYVEKAVKIMSHSTFEASFSNSVYLRSSAALVNKQGTCIYVHMKIQSLDNLCILTGSFRDMVISLKLDFLFGSPLLCPFYHVTVSS